MTEKAVDLKAEIAQVQRELVFFRDEILPTLIGEPIPDSFDNGMTGWLKEPIVTGNDKLSAWKDAAGQLSELLPLGSLPADTPPLDRKPFGQFLFQKSTPGYVVRGNRIVWRIQLHVSIDLLLLWGNPFGGTPAEGDDPWDWFAARVEVAKRWLMTLPLESSTTANILCNILPFIADLDPTFARKALDRQTWWTIAQKDTTITDEQPTERLRTVKNFWHGHIPNKAILHVLGMLANNHFFAIRDYLCHSHLIGFYTRHRMQHYLFAVLVEKVATLREMTASGIQLWRNESLSYICIDDL